MPYLWITNSSSNEKIKHSSQNPPPPPRGQHYSAKASVPCDCAQWAQVKTEVYSIPFSFPFHVLLDLYCKKSAFESN